MSSSFSSSSNRSQGGDTRWQSSIDDSIESSHSAGAAQRDVDTSAPLRLGLSLPPPLLPSLLLHRTHLTLLRIFICTLTSKDTFTLWSCWQLGSIKEQQISGFKQNKCTKWKSKGFIDIFLKMNSNFFLQ